MTRADDNLTWAEFGEVLRLPIDPERDFVSGIPWQAARFQPDLPLIDVGSGSGLTTIALAEQYPDSEIVSVEPEPMARSLQMLRIAERDQIRQRTTVLPESILDCWLPDRCGGAVLLHVIYFLGGRAREAFWERMAHVLAPNAPILMSRSYGAGPERTVEEKLVQSSRMGRMEYQRWFASHPIAGDRVEVTNTFRILQDGEQVREVVSTIHPFGLDEDVVLDEVPIGKFGIEEIDDRYVAIRRLADIRR